MECTVFHQTKDTQTPKYGVSSKKSQNFKCFSICLFIYLLCISLPVFSLIKYII